MYVRGFGFSGQAQRSRPVAMNLRPSDPNGEINIGNMLIRTLRKAYGAHFAEGCRDDEKLRDALYKGGSVKTMLAQLPPISSS